MTDKQLILIIGAISLIVVTSIFMLKSEFEVDCGNLGGTVVRASQGMECLKVTKL